MAKSRRSEHGSIIGGRLQLDRQTRDAVRIYTRVKLIQAQQEVARATAAHKRMGTAQSAGALAYAEHVYAWLSGLYAQGQHSVDPALWAESCRHVTTVERHTAAVENPTLTIPGME